MKKIVFLLVCFAMSSDYIEASSFYDTPQKNSSSIIQTTVNTGSMVNTTSNYSPNVNISAKEIDMMVAELEKNPGDINIRFQLFQAYDAIGDMNSAKKEYITLLSDEANSSVIRPAMFKFFEQKIQKNPKDANSLKSIGDIYTEEGREEDAIVYYKKAVVAEPSNPRYRIVLTMAYYGAKEYQNGIDASNLVLASDPHNSTARVYRGHCYAGLGQKDKAMQDYTFLLKYNPDFVKAKIGLYNILKDKETNDNIIKTIYPEYKTKSVDSDICFKFASDLKGSGEENDAIIFYNLAIEKNTNNASAYIDLADIYVSRGDFDKSTKLLETAQRVFPSDKEVRKKYNTLVARTSSDPLKEALELIKNGLFEDAISVYKTMKPQTSEILGGIASCYQYMGNYDEALKYLNQALKMDPNNSDVYCYFAFLYVNKQDMVSAKTYLDKALRYDPNNQKAIKLLGFVKDQEVTSLTDKAFYAFDIQNYPEALRLLNSIIAINPNKSEPYYYRGLVYVSTGKNSESIVNFKKAIELDPTNALAYYSLGVAYDSLGDMPQALSFYKIYLSKSPGDEEYVKHAELRVRELSK